MTRSADGRKRVQMIKGQVPEDPIIARLRRLESENGARLGWADVADELLAVCRAAAASNPLIMLGGTDDGSTLTFTIIHSGQKLRWYFADVDYARAILLSVAEALDPTGGPM